MAEIVLCRVDSRLVHGQVVTKWVNQSQANRIVIVSNTLVNDPFLLSIYEMSAPPGMGITCFSEEDAVGNWKQDKMGSGKILLLFPNVETLKTAYDSGLDLKSVQIGGLGGGPNRKAVFQNITLDNRDMEMLKELDSKKVDITFQTIPEDNPIGFKEIVKKFKD